MSGDIGLEQPIIFYHKKMTEAKKIVQQMIDNKENLKFIIYYIPLWTMNSN